MLVLTMASPRRYEHPAVLQQQPEDFADLYADFGYKNAINPKEIDETQL